MALFDENTTIVPARRAPMSRTTLIGVWSLAVALVALLALTFGAVIEAVQRLVGEPDAANRAILERLRQTGFELGEQVRIGDKDARMVYLTRERFASLLQV